MTTEIPTVEPKKKKRTRRNYQAELAKLEQYCDVMITMLKKHNENGEVAESLQAYVDILSMIRNGAK